MKAWGGFTIGVEFDQNLEIWFKKFILLVEIEWESMLAKILGTRNNLKSRKNICSFKTNVVNISYMLGISLGIWVPGSLTLHNESLRLP